MLTAVRNRVFLVRQDGLMLPVSPPVICNAELNTTWTTRYRFLAIIHILLNREIYP